MLAICLLLALLSGCAESAEEESGLISPGEELQSDTSDTAVRVTAFTLPYFEGQTLDPITCGDGAQRTLGALLYEGLFALSPSFETENRLCDSYTYDAERFVYTFHIRDGVLFGDGSALTARDVAAALQRAMASARYGTRLASVVSVRAATSDTVSVTLRADNRRFPALLDIPVVKNGTQDELVPLGTGPYLYITESGGDYLTRNTGWWRAASLPLDRIELVAVKDRDAMAYRFSSYEVQLLTSDLTGTDPISTTGSVCLTEADTPTLLYLGFNTRGIFSDPALRAAVSAGIDRNGLVSGYLSGHARSAWLPVSPASALYSASLESEYSVDAFSAAMTAAGYGPESGQSASVTLLVNEESSYKTAIAGSLAAALSAYRLTVTVRALPWEQYTAALQSGNYDLCLAETRLTADFDLSPLIGTGGSLNYGAYSDERMDRLLAAYLGAADGPAAMERLCAYFVHQMPITPICFKTLSVLTQQSVLTNLTPTAADPFYGMERWELHLAS